jgi:DNA polymerase-3 subunit alpha
MPRRRGRGALPNRRHPPPALRLCPSGAIAEDISIGGIVSGLRPLKTRKGDRMCVFMLDDADGSIESWSSRRHSSNTDIWRKTARWSVWGRFERDDESARIIASEIVAIELCPRAADQVGRSMCRCRHTTGSTLKRLLDILAQHKGDRKVAFVIHEQERHIRVTADVNGIRVRPSERLVSEVTEKLCGAGSVSLAVDDTR